MNRPTPTREEIALDAYLLWEAEGCPWGNDAITFANWIDAELNLQNAPPTPFPLPTE
jgi:hypothetical protein